MLALAIFATICALAAYLFFLLWMGGGSEGAWGDAAAMLGWILAVVAVLGVVVGGVVWLWMEALT